MVGAHRRKNGHRPGRQGLIESLWALPEILVAQSQQSALECSDWACGGRPPDRRKTSEVPGAKRGEVT